jgi:hypothetical protein
MDLGARRDWGVNVAEELEELLMSMTPVTLVDSLTGRDV